MLYDAMRYHAVSRYIMFQQPPTCEHCPKGCHQSYDSLGGRLRVEVQTMSIRRTRVRHTRHQIQVSEGTCEAL